MAEHFCEISINELYRNLNNPYSQANFVRSDYGDPEGPPTPDVDVPSSWSIKIFYNETAYQFNYYYADLSMSITSVFSQRGSAKFVIADDDEDAQVMPFVPVEEQRIEIWNVDETDLYFSGFISDVDPEVLYVRDDFTEAAKYSITCKDLYEELELKPVKEVYENKKLGFIVKDVIARYTLLDASDIDATMGFTVTSYPINKKRPSQVLNDICQLMNATYWIDPSTRKLKITTKDSSESRFSALITDENLYDYFSKDDADGAQRFSLRRQTDVLKNAIELEFSERYSAGTVNVSNGSNIVVGHGATPLTDWDDLPAALQFKLANSDAIYNVEKNNSAGLVQEVRLSSVYAESTASDQAYEFRGRRTSVYVSDEESIGLRRSIRGGDGIVVDTVSEDENFFTQSEAYRFAESLLVLSRPLPKGQGTTYNDVWQEVPLQAGRVINFNLPLSKRFIGDVVVQQITLKDLGGWTEIGGVDHPRLQIDMSFSATLTTFQAQMRKMMQDLRKVRVNIDTDPEKILKRFQLRETLAFKDCIHPREPIQIEDSFTLTDSIEVRTVDDAPALYYTELDYTLNEINYAFTSD